MKTIYDRILEASDGLRVLLAEWSKQSTETERERLGEALYPLRCDLSVLAAGKLVDPTLYFCLGEAYGAYATVYSRLTESEGVGPCQGWYSTMSAARRAVKGLGWAGGDGRVLQKRTLKVSGITYVLEQAEPITVDDTEERNAELRKTALAKLTEAERAALGYT
jgi:hypothetical protein